jgi:uncharacterized protein (TIGR02145 family)
MRRKISVKTESSFNEIQISQIWMTENLNVDKFCNGDIIKEAKTSYEWSKADEEGIPAWCYYDNEILNGNKFGKLYNWYAVNDKRCLAPNGWHIPSNNEWKVLINFFGDENNEKGGLQLKSKSGWEKKVYRELVINGNGNNNSGFSALPGGYREDDGKFIGIGRYAVWWSDSAVMDDINRGQYYCLKNSSGYLHDGVHPKGMGQSVRCIKDLPKMKRN